MSSLTFLLNKIEPLLINIQITHNSNVVLSFEPILNSLKFTNIISCKYSIN